MTAAHAPTIGVDFGTTNTVVSMTHGDDHARLTRFVIDNRELFAFRSALSFHSVQGERIVEAGPWAIEAYLEEPLETRFIQSFKTFAASAAFTETRILDKRYQFEDLLAAFLLRLREHAGAQMADLPPRIIVGRPVTFAGSSPNEALALTRYEAAFQRLGFTDIRYAYEPVGAAFFFARQLKQDATVLVADFGGGTSDFSLVRFQRAADGTLRSTPLSRSGVGLAGDAFDYRIIDQLVSPELGKGSEYRSFSNKLPIPQRYYAAFARWDQLALLRASKDMRDIRALERTAVEPDKIAALIEVLDGNHGYALYRSVSALKEALSSQHEATFRFEAGSVRIEKQVQRTDFEGWIAPELAAIEGAVAEALDRAGLSECGVDRVFLTGGSSFVPAVRDIFLRRFGASKIESGGEFESIASGLALIGRESDLDLWTMRAG
ncbi:Hsp70 family protein [Caulobacter segnis]|uniref:Chaperone protein DnaK n=2 Tax=Caulobacter segnis TaxID=88688 RepID=D5VJL9_CAUST|nr:Hsp70 family protein [Caulobacter segnis]ADG10428.1 chaperone protein DnaK [Caulobacter segnis ATCC 21756]AVQ02157.1 Hsp70 family protein [Caulobacter segnis]